MNKKRFTLMFIILICLLTFPLEAREMGDIIGDSFEEIAGRGLEIRTRPAGVRVFINGVDSGITPLSLNNLSPGEYSILLNREGYRDKNFNVTLFNNSRLVASIEMEEERGFVLVSVHRADGSPESLPFNPQIISSAAEEVSSPSTEQTENTVLLNMPAGYRTIRVRAFGWEEVLVNVLVRDNEQTEVSILMNPAQFRLENVSLNRRRFNPNNTGSLGRTEINFEITAPSSATIKIFNSNNQIVLERQLGSLENRRLSTTWDGRDSSGRILPEGNYSILIEATPIESSQLVSVRLECRIDYSLNIFPLSLESNLSGLTFTPLPHTLPAGSFQFDAGLQIGTFPSLTQNEDFFTVPFNFSLRVSPLNKLELATIFNINPHSIQTGWGISGSVKYNFLDGAEFPLMLGAGLSYTWAGDEGENPLSPGRGIGLYLPLSLELINSLSLAFCPGLFWRGPEGLVPAILLSAGVLYRNNWFNTGFSFRYELDFLESTDSKFLAGAQFRLLGLSNLQFLLQGGIWLQSNRIGGYGGIGIGLIY